VAEPPFVFGGGAAWSHRRLEGVLCGLASSFCSSCAFLSIGALGTSERPITMSLWFHCSATLTATVPLLLGIPTPATLPTTMDWVWLLNITWTSFVAQLLISRGFQLLAPSQAAAINLSQVLHAHVLAVTFLGEHLNWHSVLGAVLTAGGVLLTQMGKTWARDEQTSGLCKDSPVALERVWAVDGSRSLSNSSSGVLPRSVSIGTETILHGAQRGRSVRSDLVHSSMELARVM
jgi:EamA-like transporter family